MGHWAAVRELPFIAQLAGDSQEYDRWAVALLAAREQHEPFFQPPLYPIWLATIFAVFGHELDAAYLAQMGFGLLGLVGLYLAGAALGDRQVGQLAMALGAVYAPTIFYEVLIAKEGVALALVSLGLAALAWAWRRGGLWMWGLCGMTFALVALLRENFLALLPFLALAAWIRQRRCPIFAAVLVFLGATAVLLPVAWHNARSGAGWLPTTFQGGVNFWIGNHPGADGTYRPLTPGREIPRLERQEALRLAAAELGRPVSPGEASGYWFRRSLAWAAEEPGAFLKLQLNKLSKLFSAYEWPDVVDYYWVREQSPVLRLPLLEWGALVPLGVLALGYLAARHQLRALTPILGVFLVAACTTVAFFLFARYRLLLVPPLLLLVAQGAIGAAREAIAARSRGAFILLGCLGLGCWSWPHLLGHQPRRDLVAFNLGRILEESGELGRAEASYVEAAYAGSCFGPAWMNAGKLAAKRGALNEALLRLEQGVRCEPQSPEAWANLGLARSLLGDYGGAREALEQALKLDPTLEAAHRHLKRLPGGVSAHHQAPE